MPCRKKKKFSILISCKKSKNVPNLQVVEENAPKSPKFQQNCMHWEFNQLNCFDWLQNKKPTSGDSFNCGNPILSKTLCIQFILSLDIVLLASSSLTSLPFSFQSMSGKRNIRALEITTWTFRIGNLRVLFQLFCVI